MVIRGDFRAMGTRLATPALQVFTGKLAQVRFQAMPDTGNREVFVMRERSKQHQAYPRKPSRGAKDMWETRPARERTISKPRKVMDQVWRDALQYLDDPDLHGLRGMRPVGKGKLR